MEPSAAKAKCALSWHRPHGQLAAARGWGLLGRGSPPAILGAILTQPLRGVGWRARGCFTVAKTRLMKIKAASATTRGPKCERLRPPPKTLIGGSTNSSTGQWRAATRLRCRRWGAGRSCTSAPPASLLAFPSGPLGRLLERGLPSLVGERCVDAGCPVLSAVVRARRRVRATRRGSFPAFQPDTLSPPPDGGEVARA
ncbi:uncharacterized protein Tco025E_09687 [Trypanosoma conorhini]|uniref:Uncharacterized protein n=1 Tax=Trypanosoma conorhini TaxID=83891 RepID=A0A3R7LG74_9TRYP|nr:uncharacterized protein Tco025E_09687 [Trypanosoma conorhini]RNE96669.1 hypothetical protein Tco025E_09687 [Trypanosoma conorhini]